MYGRDENAARNIFLKYLKEQPCCSGLLVPNWLPFIDTRVVGRNDMVRI